MSSKIKAFLIFLLITALSATSLTGCLLPFSPPAPATGSPSVAPGVSLGAIDQAWNIIQQDYVEPARIDNAKLSGAAIKAMVDALDDPYTAYLDPQALTITQTSMQGTFDGIGATVSGENKTATVVALQPGSPAENAGIKVGDIIAAVDGVSTEGMSLTEVISRVRGPRGTSVKLSIKREGEATPLEISVVRAEIKISSVKSEMKGDIALITISSFSETTDQDLTSVLAGLPQQKATGIILDLRGNPGGYLQTVVDDASHFLKPGDLIVDVVDNKGNHSPSKAGNTNVTTNLPVVVLVDKNSASGSEVLSGALKDYKRATVAGTTTYGKGSVNILRTLRDGSGIYITIARWITPNGTRIEGKGIEPDITLTQTGNDEVNWAIDFLHSGGKVPGLVPGIDKTIGKTAASELQPAIALNIDSLFEHIDG